jgi:hypothetical protein
MCKNINPEGFLYKDVVKQARKQNKQKKRQAEDDVDLGVPEEHARDVAESPSRSRQVVVVGTVGGTVAAKSSNPTVQRV